MELTQEQLLAENEKLKADLKKLQARKSGLFIHEQPEEVELDVYEKEKLPVLKRVSDKDVVCGGKDHLLIEGDNLHTLIALQITHRNKIDVIYIDPPYNTGNKDFKYNDRFVDKEDNWRHNKWLSFMSRRLRLARELLNDSGVIFISIDDNEQAQLKLLCDDVFGEDNFVANFIWESGDGGSNDTKRNLSIINEYVLCFCKKNFAFNLAPKDKSKFKNKLSFINLATDGINIRSGEFQLVNINKQKDYLVSINLKDGSKIENYPSMCPQSTIDEWQKVGKIVVNENKVVYYKSFIEDEKAGINYKNLISNVGTAKGAGKALNEILNVELKKMYPKPLGLIKHILKIASNKNAIILDFFAGSGTTGQAVLELNKEDGGNRQFILATNNENNICEEITRERMKRVMEGYTNSKKESITGLGNNLIYFKTDFVQKSNSDTQLRLNLVDGYGDIICVGENVFGLVKETACYKIFENDKKTIAFVKSDKNLTGLVDHFKQAKGKKKVYKFELEDAKDPDFEELFDEVEGVKFFGISSIIRSYIRLTGRK